MTDSSDSQRPPKPPRISALPKRTPVRRPKSMRSRIRRWFDRKRPALWAWMTGNRVQLRRAKPWQIALFACAVLVALLLMFSYVLVDGDYSGRVGE